MRIARDMLERLVFGAGAGHRFTQDSPVMPDVWFGYGASPGGTMDLLLVPRRGTAPARLALALRDASSSAAAVAEGAGRVAYEESHVVAEMTLAGLVRTALPLSSWWDTHPGRLGGLKVRDLRAALPPAGTPPRAVRGVNDCGRWFLRLVGILAWAAERGGDDPCQSLPEADVYAPALARLLAGLRPPEGDGARRRAVLWAVNRNREAEVAMWSSTRTVKADAAKRLFALRCDSLTWAVLDTGIDATHPAFRERTPAGRLRSAAKPAAASRVRATYDFTRLRSLLHEQAQALPETLGEHGQRRAAELRRRLLAGMAIDWELIAPELRVDHAEYRAPVHPHGTHVAGILGADWRQSDAGFDAHEEEDMVGVCPDINLYDLRVLDENGNGDEFAVLAALQFVRWLNGRNVQPVIQGVNLSLSIPHDVANYACGRTPVCEEASRLHASGVVVVAAAGNRGYVHYLTPEGETDAYRSISITDPSNAEEVITVGATHRRRPHTFGVSYFSSRGPTGDGRVKPDLVAPGEKIKGPVPGGFTESMDGTSMAAPHVSGVAALLMSRHPELIGEPARVKRILCDTATDLGRERYFQGAGLVDACRALQSV
ncbi:MAG: S8 family serine peptidase [Ectothiorhodospiraceae bacterium]|nr:S8 family serine peptidase [Ectothiorhodospiraceae bacterium]